MMEQGIKIRKVLARYNLSAYLRYSDEIQRDYLCHEGVQLLRPHVKQSINSRGNGKEEFISLETQQGMKHKSMPSYRRFILVKP